MVQKSIIAFLCLLNGICMFSQTNANFPENLFKAVSVSKDFYSSEIKELNMPAEIENEIYLGKFFEVQSPLNPKYRYIYAGRVKTCRAGGCSIASTNIGKISESEFFDYYIVYDSLFSVLKVKIYNYQATHGHEVSSKGWLKQFTGYNGNKELVVNKNVDGISGATISVYAITQDISHKTSLLKEIKKQK